MSEAILRYLQKAGANSVEAPDQNMCSIVESSATEGIVSFQKETWWEL